jgi:DNA-directed RNA polymerase subunit M/transcription elongation factor TFIIS
MSKKMKANITCSKCRNSQDFYLYRTLWIEVPENRDLVLSDKVNYFKCNSCGYEERLQFPFLCTNSEKKYAVWFEPYHDAQIDIDRELYKKHSGENSYFARAPRIKDWDEFKKMILELEKSKSEGDVNVSEGASLAFQDFIDEIKGSVISGASARALNPIPILTSILFLFIPMVDFLTDGDIDLDEGYFTLLRMIVFGTFGYLAWFYFQARKKIFLFKMQNEIVVWALAFGAMLFNPFIQVHFEEEAWILIDLLSILLISLCVKDCPVIYRFLNRAIKSIK